MLTLLSILGAKNYIEDTDNLSTSKTEFLGLICFVGAITIDGWLPLRFIAISLEISLFGLAYALSKSNVAAISTSVYGSYRV
jgi:hypothetical protein